MRGSRRDHDQVRPTGQLDMAHCGLGFLVPEVVAHGASGDRLQGGGRDELVCATGEHDLYLRARLAQESYKDWGFIRSDSAGNP